MRRTTFNPFKLLAGGFGFLMFLAVLVELAFMAFVCWGVYEIVMWVVSQ